ncbi:hypothetical protein JB92DRAFT_2901160 [Gautieria morchelliformis]|nr:hypothetical protein JB92DRAFT_2901160 [Gautieria morchelliformis]
MAPAPRLRKRNRKRKRRNVSSSSSSSSSSSEDDGPSVVPAPSKAPPAATADKSGSESDTSSSSSSASSTSLTSSVRIAEPTKKSAASGPSDPPPRRQPSRSPFPPDTTLPALLPADPATDAGKGKEQALKAKFREFWMASIADGFKDDLEQIRKEPNMTTSRLGLLIDALASGADVFSSVAQPVSGNEVNEMEVVLNSSS